jgi:hypothetical protein
MEVSDQLAFRPGRFTLGEIAPGTHWIGRWVGPSVEKTDILHFLRIDRGLSSL